MKFLLLIPYCFLSLYTNISFAQTCKSNVISTAPNSRYTLNSNGTVLDKKTGLMWMRCALGQTWNSGTCTGLVKTYTWQGALQTAESTAFAGFSDWRLPNQKELQSLVEYRCYSPAINLTAFPNAATGLFLSSSPSMMWESSIQVVNFDIGNYGDDVTYYSYAVRLVRVGQ